MKIQNLIVIIVASFFLLIACNHTTKTQKRSKKKIQKKAAVAPLVNADSAYYYVEKQVSFGPRIAGTSAHSECAKWLAEKLKQYADTVIVQNFKARTYDEVSHNGKNIIASFNPDDPKRVLLMAHWDSRPFADYDPDEANHNTPIDGANDGASGTGVLIEIARQMSMQPASVGVDIVLFDLEDWGPPKQMNLYIDEYWGLGSQYWSKQPHIFGYDASFGILLDMVGTKNPTFRKEYFSQQYARYFQDLVWTTATELGYDKYFLNEDGPAINDDHVFVNRIAKIPSINIIHLESRNSQRSFFEHWHTVNDNMEHINKESLRMVGHVVMTVVYNE